MTEEASSAVGSERIRLGISSCLLGEKVRYDGGHKLDHFLRDTLGRFVEYVPVCPEVECGLPVPREAMRLVGDPAAPRLVTSRSGVDHTDRMLSWAGERVERLAEEGLCGFVFKSGSPSSGMERVKVYAPDGMPSKIGVGIFARVFQERFPLLPVEEEGRLNDSALRENFIERLFSLKRWRDMLARGKTRRNLVEFHTREKLLILSHSPEHYRALGRLVAHASDYRPEDLFAEYQNLLLTALRLKSTPRKNSNVLQHCLGYFKNVLGSDEKQELLEVIERYRAELVPLVVPTTLVNHHVRKYAERYLRDQTYLNPHPVELRLRNHV